MKYTEEQLKFIREKKPELIKKTEPSLNDAIVEFLKKYEVFVKPPKDTSRRDGAIAGAITGFAGADVGGDAFMISGQNKQTKIQEWTQWKQWALDHKDFPKFQTDLLSEVGAYNENIDRKLEDLAFQKEIDPLIKKFEDEKIKKQKAKDNTNNFFGFIFILFFALFVGALFYSSIENQQQQQDQIDNELGNRSYEDYLEDYFKNKK